MLRLTSKITIDNGSETFILDHIKKVEASTSWDTLVDMATVELPKNIFVRKGKTKALVSLAERAVVAKDLSLRSQNPNTPLFKVGDKIKIEIGYDFNFNVLLEGFITNISATVPIVLKCADPMWILDRIELTTEPLGATENKPPTLSSLLQHLTASYIASSETTEKTKVFKELKTINFKKAEDTSDFPLVNYSVKNKTILQVLEELKKRYYVYSYYQIREAAGEVVAGRDIVCGNYYKETKTLDLKGIKKFHFQNNVISEELIDKKEEDVKVAIEATDIKAQGGSQGNTTETFGSKQPGAKTLFMSFHNMKEHAGFIDVKKILEEISVRRLKTIRYTGYAGSFVTFGKPFVKHGETIQLIDDYLTDRNGLFKVRQVDYSFGDGGFRQKIYPHIKAGD